MNPEGRCANYGQAAPPQVFVPACVPLLTCGFASPPL